MSLQKNIDTENLKYPSWLRNTICLIGIWKKYNQEDPNFKLKVVPTKEIFKHVKT